MTNQATFEYLAGYYASALRDAYSDTYGKNRKEKELQGYGKWDKAFKPFRENCLWELFDRCMCRNTAKLVLSDKDGRNIYSYNGKYYEKIGNSDFLQELVKRTFRILDIGLFYMQGTAKKVALELQSTIKSSDEFLYSPNRRYIVFNNGVFDLKDGKIKGHDPRYVTDIVLDFDYVGEKECYMKFYETCRLWDRFLGDRNTGVFPNKDVASDFQSFCGAFLMDRDMFKFEYMACIHGPGSNGKSVLVDAVSGVFGEKYYSTFTPSQLFKEGTNSSFCVSDLEGKLLNIVGDLDKSDFSGGTFKRFISGEKIRAREPYGKSFRFVKPPLMVCCANEFPETNDDSEGHHRRLLPFESTHKMWTEKDKDPMLTAKLTTPEARAYIFNWIYKGYKRILNNDGRLPLSEFTLKAQERLKANANSMRRWWKESEWELPEKEGFWKPLKELFEEYVEYCEKNYYTQRKRHELSAMLRSKGLKDSRRAVGVCFFIRRKNKEELEEDLYND